jgi:hypothetical protein
MRVSDRQSLVETAVHILVQDKGPSGPFQKKDKKLRKYRLSGTNRERERSENDLNKGDHTVIMPHLRVPDLRITADPIIAEDNASECENSPCVPQSSMQKLVAVSGSPTLIQPTMVRNCTEKQL